MKRILDQSALIAVVQSVLKPTTPADVVRATPFVGWRAEMPCDRCGVVTELRLDFALTAEVDRMFDAGAAFACHCQKCGSRVMGMFRRIE